MLNDQERHIRKAIFDSVVNEQSFPSVEELAALLGQDRLTTKESLAALDSQHEVVLDQRGEISMLMPFSAVPTPHTVKIGSRSWWANCAWDALGITAAMKQDGEIETECPVTGEKMALGSGPAGLDPGPTRWVNFAVPAARWWDDIFFT